MLTLKEKVGYGIGAFGKDLVYALVSGFILFYFNDVLGISASFTGVMMMIAMLFDAFNDPIMGVLVEKTRSKYGKFRPWIFLGTLLNAFVLYLMFSIPSSFSGGTLLFYASLMYVLWGMTYTLMDIPFWSMIPSLTKPGKEREELSVIGRTSSSIGFAIPTVLTMIVVPLLASSERLGFSYFALFIAIIFVITEIICVLSVKEKTTENKKTVKVKDMFKALLHNDQTLIVVIGIVIFNASTSLTTQLALYFFKYDIGNEQFFSLFGAIGGAAQIIAMVIFPLLRKKFSLQQLLYLAIGCCIFGYLALFILASIKLTYIALLGIAAFIIYFGGGIITILTTVFLSDTIEYGEYKNGDRNEGVTFSMQTFVVKLASAFAVLIAGIGLDLVGLDQNLPVQSEQTLLGLRLIMTVLPIIRLIIMIIVFKRKYILNDNKMKEIINVLNNKK